MWAALMMVGAVSWSAPPICPPESELQKRLGDVRSRVDARVVEHPAGFELSVSIDDQQRTLVLPTCQEALESAVFLVELSGQFPSQRRPLNIPENAEPSDLEAPLPVRRRPLNISLEEQAAVRAKTLLEPETPDLRRRFRLAVVAGAEWALLPSAVARLGVSLQLDTRWLRFVLDLRAAPPLRFSSFNSGVEVSPLFDTQLGACRLFAFDRLEIGPCVQGSLGLISATGVNVAVPKTQVFSVWTAGAGLRAALILTESLELQAFAAARFGPEVRYFFADDGLTAVRSNFVGIDTGLGVGGRW